MILYALAVAAAAATPAADPVAIVDRALAGAPTQVMVLGTAHLSDLPPTFAAARLVPLIDRLARWHPQVVTIEAVSGADCDYLRSFTFRYPETAKSYCVDPADARAATGLDQAGAEAAIATLLATPAADRPPATRRRLAALFMASGDRTSALVQWLRLTPAERRADTVLTAPLVATLNTLVTRPNENYLVAAPLAARLGLERVYPVDDHSGDAAAGPDTPDQDRAMAAIWGNPAAAAARAEHDARTAAMVTSGDVVGWYRWINSPPYADAAMRADFGAAIADRSASQTGRRYLAYWETRNLRMVANIRAAYGPMPGVRVLSIVGASHKPYYERYLRQLSDTRLVPAATLLD